MNQAVAIAQKQQIATVREALEKMKGQFMQALPKHITPERLCRVAMTAIQNTPKLLECDRNSLYSAIMRAAQLGLEPDGVLGQAYLIPYGKQVQFIPGYKGLIDLARRSGEVSNIIAKEVYEADEFTVDWSQEPPFTHKPSLSGERGQVQYFWAMARFKDGGYHWDFMTRAEVEVIRDGSQGWQSAVKYGKQKDSPWEKHFVEMAKKTMIRRIAKYLPMSVQKAAAFDAMQEAGKQVSIDDYGDITIDGTAEEVPAQSQEPIQSGKLDGFAQSASSPAHDPDTGEVLESESSVIIELLFDGEKPRWAGWAADFMAAIEKVETETALAALRDNHAVQLDAFQKHNPAGAKELQKAFAARAEKLKQEIYS